VGLGEEGQQPGVGHPPGFRHRPCLLTGGAAPSVSSTGRPAASLRFLLGGCLVLAAGVPGASPRTGTGAFRTYTPGREGLHQRALGRRARASAPAWETGGRTGARAGSAGAGQEGAGGPPGGHQPLPGSPRPSQAQEGLEPGLHGPSRPPRTFTRGPRLPAGHQGAEAEPAGSRERSCLSEMRQEGDRPRPQLRGLICGLPAAL